MINKNQQKTIKKLIVFVSFCFILLLLFNQKVKAQTISLSITPPITEAIVKPGVVFKQSYLLGNQGFDTLISIKLVSFSPLDQYGNIKLEESLLDDEVGEYSNWFEIEYPEVDFGEDFSLLGDSQTEVVVKITPPIDTIEGDYYFTLLFETNTDRFLSNRGSVTKAKIGTNILLTVSEGVSPLKIAKISKFEAPFLIDSFSNINYQVEVSNTGSYLFKPAGNISIVPSFGQEQSLKLAPLNILASSTREVPCIADDALISCSIKNRLIIGKQKAILKFNLDEKGSSYEMEVETFVFPFSIIAGVIVVLIIFRIAIAIALKPRKISKKR